MLDQHAPSAILKYGSCLMLMNSCSPHGDSFTQRFCAILSKLADHPLPQPLCTAFLLDGKVDLVTWLEANRRHRWMPPATMIRSAFEICADSQSQDIPITRLGVEKVIHAASKGLLTVVYRGGWRPVKAPDAVSARDIADAISAGLVHVAARGTLREGPAAIPAA